MIRVAAGGDLQLGSGSRPSQVEGIAPILDGDLRFANFEGTLSANGGEAGLDGEGRPVAGQVARFAAPIEDAAWLSGRLDVVSLANNHALDRGEAGRDETVRALSARGVAAAFPGHDAAIERGGRRVTVIAREFAPSVDLDGESEVVRAVGRARAAGPVIVSLHWGHTGSLLPSPAQRRLAARIADAGAVAVLGHGPHSPQGIERRGRAVIAYSMGNLALGCRCSDEDDAYALSFAIDAAGGAGGVRVAPIAAGLHGDPPRPSGDEGLAELLVNLSRDLGSAAARDGAGISIE
jgi:Bacterial capsule synthesis protein PGA_cap